MGSVKRDEETIKANGGGATCGSVRDARAACGSAGDDGAAHVIARDNGAARGSARDSEGCMSHDGWCTNKGNEERGSNWGHHRVNLKEGVELREREW